MIRGLRSGGVIRRKADSLADVVQQMDDTLSSLSRRRAGRARIDVQDLASWRTALAHAMADSAEAETLATAPMTTPPQHLARIDDVARAVDRLNAALFGATEAGVEVRLDVLEHGKVDGSRIFYPVVSAGYYLPAYPSGEN